MADHKMKVTNFITFLDQYGNTILDLFDLKNGLIQDNVMKSIVKFPRRGSGNLPAIWKYNHLLEEIMLDTDDE